VARASAFRISMLISMFLRSLKVCTGTGVGWLNSAARAAVQRPRRNGGHPGRMALKVEGHGRLLHQTALRNSCLFASRFSGKRGKNAIGTPEVRGDSPCIQYFLPQIIHQRIRALLEIG